MLTLATAAAPLGAGPDVFGGVSGGVFGGPSHWAEFGPETGRAALSVDAVLAPYVYPFYAGFLVAFLFTPVMRRVAVHYGIVDRPDGLRKLHRAPVAYLGGVAVFLGWMAALAVSQFSGIHATFTGGPPHAVIPAGVFSGAMLIVALGLWDDVYGLRARLKIVGQVTGGCLLIGSGIGTELTGPFLHNLANYAAKLTGLAPAPHLLDVAVYVTSALFTVGLVVFCCNAANLMDGLDGLCGGVTAIIVAGLIFLAANLATANVASRVPDDALRLVIGVGLLGAVLAFVAFNFNPASIFMGDAGSMFLGFACATLIVLIGQVQAKWLLAGLVMFSLPVLDTALAFARRWMAGRSWFSPDKHHFHHQLVARGLSVKQAVLISYGLAVFFVLLGAAVVYVRTRYAVALYLVIFGYIVVAAYKMGMVHERPIGPRAGRGVVVPTEPASNGSPSVPNVSAE